MGPLTIVMYHYVRPLAGSRYPRIKGLETRAFEYQLDHLQRHHRLVQPAQVLRALRGERLPERAALLTFDDGYKDHVRHVYPALKARGLSGVFFPPTSAIENRELLDVNRVHHILACVDDAASLVPEVERAMAEAAAEFELEPVEAYRRRFREANRFDTADVIYVKRLLQHALPEALRTRIARQLFARHVSADERSFADELYLDDGDLREMSAGGMEVGSHGHRHHWLGRLDADEQAQDIDRSLQYLSSIDLGKRDFWFCYPYGSYNTDTLRLLRERGCAAAVTTVVDVASCEADKALELPRLDTNDLPQSGDETRNQEHP
jgi:peptidoglycan/xylan/chitin deacetylase (PgdA/CDA1 family)